MTRGIGIVLRISIGLLCYFLLAKAHIYSSSRTRTSQWMADYSYQSYSDTEEAQRIAFWYENYGSWPIPELVEKEKDESAEYHARMEMREKEIMQIKGKEERWENWIQFIQSRLVPKFTGHGFEISRQALPTDIELKLFQSIEKYMNHIRNISMDDKKRNGTSGTLQRPLLFLDQDLELLEDEHYEVAGIYHKSGRTVRPRFLPIDFALASNILNELKPLHEKWAGIELVKTGIYALRLYRGGQSLAMHLDRVSKHVISSIIHLTSDEPWPIDLEDHDGEIHSINLRTGDIFFYESARCFHGRRREFGGKYYGSLFVHYHPKESTLWNFTISDISSRVPPHWCFGCISVEDEIDNLILDDSADSGWMKMGTRERSELCGSHWSASALTTSSMLANGAKSIKTRGLLHHDWESAPYEF